MTCTFANFRSHHVWHPVSVFLCRVHKPWYPDVIYGAGQPGSLAHLLYLGSLTRMAACHVVHVLCSNLAVIILCLHLSLLALLLGFMLLLHVLDVCAGIPVRRHLWYCKVPLASCWHSTRLNHTVI